MSRSRICHTMGAFKRIPLKTLLYVHGFCSGGKCGNRLLCSHVNNDVSSSRRQFVPFENLIKNRREEAERTLLVQVKTEQSCKDLLAYCKKYGMVEGMHFYTLNNNNNFVLVEFGQSSVIPLLLKECEHLDINQVVPVRSSLLWFRSDSRFSKSGPPMKLDGVTFTKQRVNPISPQQVDECLMSASSFSDQIRRLHEKTKLNDLGIRLRFLAAHQVENALKGLFPTSKVFPFGSSINGFGRLGCDLDLALRLDTQTLTDEVQSRLIFHVKSCMGMSRNQMQKQMEIIADLLQFFLPGCSQVKRILQARVPILKYKQDLMGLDCDLSMTNMVAVHMAELLYLYGSYDDRVYPLVFTVRYWAKEVNLTNEAPGRWITNFSLTLLVLFYLQRIKILPAIEVLIKHQRPEDERICDDGTNCSFLRDLREFPGEISNNDDNLFTLLFEFFQFYATFDFSSYAISLNTGNVIMKPEYSPVYIVNPLEKHLNVTKNISQEECEKLKIECRNAAWIIESSISAPDTEKSKDKSWGLLKLVKNQASRKVPIIRNGGSMKGPPRLMSVKELFPDDCDLGVHEASYQGYKKVKPR